MSNENAETYDVVVIGAGGAGMASALFAAIKGLRVLLVERTEYVGGTTAYSGGTAWIPNTVHSKAVGEHDSFERARAYLNRVIDDPRGADLRDAFLRHGPRALDVLESQSHVRFQPYAYHPDYESEVEDATLRGRALEPVPFDGRTLGRYFPLLRAPIPETTVLGGMMVSRKDINHLLAMTKSWASFRHSTGIVARHVFDRMRYPRGTRLVLGNALCARLLRSLIDRGVAIWTKTEVVSIDQDGDGIAGVTLERDGARVSVRARRGVVLASGGFNRHAALRDKLMPHCQTFTPGAPGHTGAALELALKQGASMGATGKQSVFWAPVSTRRRADGSTAVFPHFFDRAKPGTLVVNARGKRFLNEGISYHRFGAEMVAQNEISPCIPGFFIADAVAFRKYGMGMVRPRMRNIQPFINDGYLSVGATLAELAGKLGIDAAALEETVQRMNRFAKSGIDEDFDRGETRYQNNIGDPEVGPNPNLGALTTAPYYAVRLYPGDIGASTGLVTDADARVLATNGEAIKGLYACGNDMNSVMNGTYPGPGITIGPALAFAYVAIETLVKNDVAVAA